MLCGFHIMTNSADANLLGWVIRFSENWPYVANQTTSVPASKKSENEVDARGVGPRGYITHRMSPVCISAPSRPPEWTSWLATEPRCRWLATAKPSPRVKALITMKVLLCVGTVVVLLHLVCPRSVKRERAHLRDSKGMLVYLSKLTKSANTTLPGVRVDYYFYNVYRCWGRRAHGRFSSNRDRRLIRVRVGGAVTNTRTARPVFLKWGVHVPLRGTLKHCGGCVGSSMVFMHW